MLAAMCSENGCYAATIASARASLNSLISSETNLFPLPCKQTCSPMKQKPETWGAK
jgi:hypothetical protein